MKNLNPKQQIALDGELLVASYLSGRCAVFNKNGESYLPFDIFWKGIKIDVKSTSLIQPKRCYFSITTGKTWDAAHDTILVFAYIGKPNHFWVSHSSQKQSGTKLINDSIRGFELEKAILDEYYKYSLLYKKTVDNMLSVE